MLGDEFLEVLDEPLRGNRAFHQATQADPGVFVHDGADLDRFAAFTGIELEIDRSYGSWRDRSRRFDS